MPFTSDDLTSLSKCALDAALDAGRIIASRANEPITVMRKEGGNNLASQVVTEVDLLSEAAIIKRLSPSCEDYGIAMLTEESDDDKARLEAKAFWCIDPIDGTLAFIESTPGYSVSIALVAKSGLPLIGVVYDPVTKTLYSAVRGQGAFLNGKPWSLGSGLTDKEKALTLVCDRSLDESRDFPQVLHHFEAIAERMGLSGVSTVHKRGAVMNACRVLENGPACYFKFPKAEEGGGSLWDFAATACLFNELGAIATDFHGEPLELNRAESTFMNHRGVMYATDNELAAEIRRVITDNG